MQIENIKNWKNFLITKDKTVKSAMIKLNKSVQKTLFVINNFKEKKLIGSISDGDIRRFIINGFKISESVETVAFKKCLTVKSLEDVYKKKQIIIKYSIYSIPQIDKFKRISSIYYINSENLLLNNFQETSYPVLIMAGGRGERLGEITKKLPKPMVLINNSTIISRILNQLIDQQFINISISIHYLSHKIKNYLRSYSEKLKIDFIEEKNPLGTIGSISKLKKNPKKLPIVIINSDIILSFNLKKILNFHFKSKSKMTIVGAKYIMQNPYGVLQTNEKEELKEIIEKPSIESLVSAGIYIVDYSLIKYVSKNKKTDIDYFIKKIIKKKIKISVYSHEDYWYELGTVPKINNFKKIVRNAERFFSYNTS